MHSYELTERGKIVVTIVLVFLILIVPAVIIAINAGASQPSTPPDEPGASSTMPPPDGPPSDYITGPLPENGSGFNPPTTEDPHINGPGESNGPDIPDPTETTEPAETTEPTEATDPTEATEPTEPAETTDPPVQTAPTEPPEPDPPEYGLIGVDSSEGTLSFLFSTVLQTEIDDETKTALSVFLDSPKNNSGTLITAEMPRMSDDDAKKVTSAVINAFAPYRVPRERLSFITNHVSAQDQLITIKLSYVQAARPK